MYLDVDNEYIRFALTRYAFFHGPTPVEDISVLAMRQILAEAHLLELNERKEYFA